MKISVLESGGWGTALSISLLSNGHDVTLHSLHSKKSDQLRSTLTNPYLPGVTLPSGLVFADGFDGIEDADVIFFVTPSYALRSTAQELHGRIKDSSIVVSASKGIESGTSKIMTQILEEELGNGKRIAVISGPSHAEEVARGIPTGCVAASICKDTAEKLQDIMMSPVFRVYSSNDVIGVEICAALKNVIAISAGIADGLGFGDNTLAMLMTRGLNEMAALCKALGGRKETVAGLAGIGDLIVTCTSRHSRNRRAGLYIGQGLDVETAMKKVGATVEGYYACLAAHKLCKDIGTIEMPIASELYDILYSGKPSMSAFKDLMSREKKPELDERWLF